MNLDVVHTICDLLDELKPREDGHPHRSLIGFVTDRPGHDFRYAIDPSKIEGELGWRAAGRVRRWDPSHDRVVPRSSRVDGRDQIGRVSPADWARRVGKSPYFFANGVHASPTASEASTP